ncbi:MAG: hypothetical protein HOV94_16495 [Saccharothrix sp.]|nr:hypothetical protein [Saccharothrix sp.]
MADLLGTRLHVLRRNTPFVHTDVLDRLAVLTGYSTTRLGHVFPRTAGIPPTLNQVDVAWDLRDRYQERPLKPCQHCTATRRPDYAIIHSWRPREQRVCARHHRWIGPDGNNNDVDQLNVTAVPEIGDAGRHLTNLVCKHGRDRVLKVLDLAEQCVHTLQLASIDTHDERAERLGIGDGHHRISSLAHAVAFPEVVALTKLLCSGYWRTALAHPDDTARAAAQQRFENQVNADVRPFWRWELGRYRDRLTMWAYARYPRLAPDVSEELHRFFQQKAP